MSALSAERIFQGSKHLMAEEVSNSLVDMLTNGARREKVRAALVCMRLAYKARSIDPTQRFDEGVVSWFQPLRDPLADMVDGADPQAALAASWALAWIGYKRLSATPPDSGLLLALFGLWREAGSDQLARKAAWALAAQPLLPRDTFTLGNWGDCEAFLRNAKDGKDRTARDGRNAALVVAWYRRAPWSDAELAERVGQVQGEAKIATTMRDILLSLGEEGQRVLEKLEKGRTGTR